SAGSYGSSSYGSSSYGSDSYRSDSYRAEPGSYGTDSYAPSSYGAGSYTSSPYGTDSYRSTDSFSSGDSYSSSGSYSSSDSYSSTDSYSGSGSYSSSDSYKSTDSFGSTEPYARSSSPDRYQPDPYGPGSHGVSQYPGGADSTWPAADPTTSGPTTPNQTTPGPTTPGSAASDPMTSDPMTSAWPAAEETPSAAAGGWAEGAAGGPTAHDHPARGPSGHPAPASGRAGRNLPAAIAVGLGLGAAAVASLFLWRPAFLGVIALFVGVATWELVRAIRTQAANPPLIPLVAGGVLMSGLAWWGKADGLTFGLVVTVLAVLVWRLAEGPDGYGRDVSSGALVAVYLPFLAGFAALMASVPADGDWRVIVTLAGVVLSDTGGDVAGDFFGRHPKEPPLGPRKSWKGDGGSVVASAIGGAILLHFLLDVSPLWGAVFGIGVSAAAILGDLAESMIKRDLGVKDMSTLLPGHGGLMDRLDSILFALPAAYLMLLLIAPPG